MVCWRRSNLLFDAINPAEGTVLVPQDDNGDALVERRVTISRGQHIMYPTRIDALF
jgi:hypothetical protein